LVEAENWARKVGATGIGLNSGKVTGAFLPFLNFYRPKIYRFLFTTGTFPAYIRSINILP
jgi:hypothetical protein